MMSASAVRLLWFSLCLVSTLGISQNVHAALVVWAADSDGRLGTIDIVSGDVSVIGILPEVMTDIAFAPNGDLYGITFNELWKINPTDATAFKIGPTFIPGGNSMTFAPDGTLYASGSGQSDLYTVHTGAGFATSLGSIGLNETGAGDLAFINQKIYWSATSGRLLEVSLSPSFGGVVVGDMGNNEVYGLATHDQSTLWGLQGTTLFGIDLNTAQLGPSINFGGQGLNTVYGATFRPGLATIPEPSSVTLAAAMATYLVCRRRSRKSA